MSGSVTFPFSVSCLNWQISLGPYFTQMAFALHIFFFHQPFSPSFFPEIHDLFVQLFLITALKIDASCLNVHLLLMRERVWAHCARSPCSRIFPRHRCSVSFKNALHFTLSLLTTFNEYQIFN